MRAPSSGTECCSRSRYEAGADASRRTAIAAASGIRSAFGLKEIWTVGHACTHHHSVPPDKPVNPVKPVKPVCAPKQPRARHNAKNGPYCGIIPARRAACCPAALLLPASSPALSCPLSGLAHHQPGPSLHKEFVLSTLTLSRPRAISARRVSSPIARTPCRFMESRAQIASWILNCACGGFCCLHCARHALGGFPPG